MSKLPVIGITAFKNVESPQPGFGVARCLKEKGYTVIGLDDIPITSAVFAPYVDILYLVKSMGEENIEVFIEELKKIKEETNMEILIPCYDREVYFFSKCRTQIESIGIKLLMPSPESLKLAAKPFLSKLNEKGICTPKTIRVSSEEEVDSACKELGFPVVCKGIIKDAYIAKNESEARQFFQKIREIWHGGKGSILMQEFILGETFTISGSADKESNVVSKIIIKKLGIDSKGTTWSGITYESKEVEELCSKIISELKWIGPFELEFLKDVKTGNLFLFEINPRLPSWIYLSNAVGCNVPEKIVQIIQGEKIDTNCNFKKDIVFFRFSEEVFLTKEEFEKFKNSGKRIKPIFGIGGKKYD